MTEMTADSHFSCQQSRDQLHGWPIQGAAEKSNPLTCFANSLATDYNFVMKLCIDIVCSYCK